MQLEFNFFIFLACKWDIVPLKGSGNFVSDPLNKSLI